MKHNKLSKLCKVVLAVCMMFSLTLPTKVEANDKDARNTVVDGMSVDKTAKLEADGTYTINLEAYATGEVTTTEVTKYVPCDIVMVLDMSGSMKLPMGDAYYSVGNKGWSAADVGWEVGKADQYKTGYYHINKKGLYAEVYVYHQNNQFNFYSDQGDFQYLGKWVPNSTDSIVTEEFFKPNRLRLDALKESAKKFIGQVEGNAKANRVDHRIALTTFSENGAGQWDRTGIYNGKEFIKYAQSGNVQTSDITNEQYQKSLLDVRTSYSELTSAIDTMSVDLGRTYANYGMELAENIFQARDITEFPGPDEKPIKRNKVVVFFTDGYPGNEPGNTEVFDEAHKNISVANATITVADRLKSEQTKIYSIATLYGADPKSKYDFRTNAENTSYSPDGIKAMNAFLHYISSDWQHAGDMLTPQRETVVNNGYYFDANDPVKLDEVFETITGNLDEITTTVELDEKAVIRDIISNEFKLPEDMTSEDFAKNNVNVSTMDYKGNDNWDNLTDVTKDMIITVNENKDTIDVEGFSYKDNYVVEAMENPPHYSASGKKLRVTITGVLAKDDTNGISIDTNNVMSGVYSNGDKSGILAAPFPMPKVNIPEKSYVLDYGKPVDVATNEILGKKASALAVDTGYNKQDTNAYKTVTKNGYGSAKLTNTDVNYAPGRINWDKISRFGILAELDDKTNADYEWSAVNFIPANSVYYEDDFAITENTGNDGNVSIVYGGNWTEVKGANDDKQSSDNTVYGKDGSYDDEKGYSDGGVHSATSGATATFNFTGTGVDIYSSTNSDACTVYAFLYNSDGKMIKYALCDNYGADGKYYTVPTVAFEGLEYGTYKVELLVSASQTNLNATTYYLDGIRVYNPLGKVTDDGSTAGDAYKEAGELNAVFTEIRSMLLKGNAEVNGKGMLYFDQVKDENGVNKSELATYESVGPEHEAYLSNGNGIAFTMKNFTDEAVYVGIKLVKSGSKDATVEVTNGNGEKTRLTINSTADTYFPITPDNGKVAIKNISGEDGAVVSVTKVRTTSPTTNDVEFVSNSETVSYISAFNDLPVTGEEVEQPDDGRVTIGDIINEFKNVLDKIKDWFGRWGK